MYQHNYSSVDKLNEYCTSCTHMVIFSVAWFSLGTNTELFQQSPPPPPPPPQSTLTSIQRRLHTSWLHDSGWQFSLCTPTHQWYVSPVTAVNHADDSRPTGRAPLYHLLIGYLSKLYVYQLHIAPTAIAMFPH